MAAAAGEDKVTLVSSDWEVFEVEEAVAMESQTIKHTIEDCDGSGMGIPLPNVTGNILAKVIEYLEMHVEVQKRVEDCDGSVPIPLPKVTGNIVAKVIEYYEKHVDDSWNAEFIECCKKHVELQKQVEESESAVEELKAWDAEFVKVDQATLFDLIHAANYLNIKSLLDLTCQTVADMIKGKTPEEISKTFNIGKNFTPEEEEIRKENQWAFE